jgi:hypothetical protein
MAGMLDADADEPTDEFGFGISSWLGILRYLMGVFTFLSMMALYLASVYKNQD